MGFVSFSLYGKIGLGIPGLVFINMAFWVGGVKKKNVTDNGGTVTPHLSLDLQLISGNRQKEMA